MTYLPTLYKLFERSVKFKWFDRLLVGTWFGLGSYVALYLWFVNMFYIIVYLCKSFFILFNLWILIIAALLSILYSLRCKKFISFNFTRILPNISWTVIFKYKYYNIFNIWIQICLSNIMSFHNVFFELKNKDSLKIYVSLTLLCFKSCHNFKIFKKWCRCYL